jgi:hypothetical protein
MANKAAGAQHLPRSACLKGGRHRSHEKRDDPHDDIQYGDGMVNIQNPDNQVLDSGNKPKGADGKQQKSDKKEVASEFASIRRPNADDPKTDMYHSVEDIGRKNPEYDGTEET